MSHVALLPPGIIERARRLDVRRTDVLIGLGLALASAVVGFVNLTGSPVMAEDEGTYTAQAFAIFDGRLAPYTYWYDHPPLGWLLMALPAWLLHALGLPDGTHIGAARGVAVLATALSVFLLFRLARRLHLRRGPAALGCLLLFLSPLPGTLLRQAYLDVIALPWLLGAFVLVFSPRRGLWPHVLAGVCFAMAVLTKETVALAGPALLVALVHRRRWSTRAFSVVGFLAAGALALSFYPLMALLRGELVHSASRVSLQDALAYQFLTRSGSGTLWEAGSARQELLSSWWAEDPWLIGLGILGALVATARRGRRFIVVYLLVAALPLVFGSGYLPAMYVAASLPFLALGAAAGADAVWGVALRRLGLDHPGRVGVRRAVGTLACAALLAASAPSWAPALATRLTHDANADWRLAMEYVRDRVPADDTVLVPYSMWQDVAADRGRDQWRVIVTEKLDLDSAFTQHHPQGWRSVRWVVVGPIVTQNIENLGLTGAGEAVAHSQEVATYGAWSVRRVDDAG